MQNRNNSKWSIISSPFPNHVMQRYCGLSLLLCAGTIDIDNVDFLFVYLLCIPWNSSTSDCVKYDEKSYYHSFSTRLTRKLLNFPLNNGRASVVKFKKSKIKKSLFPFYAYLNLDTLISEFILGKDH
jgi:hypothetical protein